MRNLQRLQGLAATLLVLAILVGVPVVLVGLATRPGFLPSWLRLTTALSAPDDGRLLIVVIWIAAWIVWAMMAWLILREVAATIRGIQTPHLPAVAIPQGMARRLVAASALLFIALPNAPTPQIAHADPGPVATDTAVHTADSDTHAPDSSTTNQVEVVVVPGDTLWGTPRPTSGTGTGGPRSTRRTKAYPKQMGAASPTRI